jgi:hypothetical protein
MVADSKKVQTMINVAADEVTTIREALVRLQAIKIKFQTANPDVSGTPLEGNVTALNNALTDLQTEADRTIWTQLIAARVPSHRGKALEE